MNYGGIHPAVIESYTAGSRFCMISIPGVTDGADSHIEAEIGQSLGDKSEHTDVRILPGDRVWVMFMGGDPKHPVITHFRAKAAGNEVGTRRWHHDNIETDADETQKHTAGTTYRVEAGESITLVVGENVASFFADSTMVKMQIGNFYISIDAAGVGTFALSSFAGVNV